MLGIEHEILAILSLNQAPRVFFPPQGGRTRNVFQTPRIPQVVPWKWRFNYYRNVFKLADGEPCVLCPKIPTKYRNIRPQKRPRGRNLSTRSPTMSAQYVGEVAHPQPRQYAAGEIFGEQVRDERDRNARVQYLVQDVSMAMFSPHERGCW